MNIACDVDDTVCDLVTTWLRIYNEENDDDLQKEAITNWAIGSFTKIGEKFYDYLKRPGLYSLVDPIDGALDGVKLLRDSGHRVFFVTANGDGSKHEWLKNNGFLDSNKDYVECYDKSLIRADMLIDDGVHNLMGFVGKRIQFLQPWNVQEFVPGAWLACNWNEVPQIVEDMMIEEQFQNEKRK